MSVATVRLARPGIVIATTTGIQTLVSAGTLTLPAIAPQLSLALGVEPALIGLQVSIVYIAATLTSLFGGRSVERYGAARTSQICLLLLGAGLTLSAVPMLASIALGSLVMGMAYGLPNPAAAHLLNRYTTPTHRNLVFSLKQTGVPLGGGLAGLLAPRLTSAYGWQTPLLIAAGIALLLALAIGVARPVWDDDRHPEASLARNLREPIAAVLGVPALRALLTVGFLLAGVQLCVIAFAAILLVSDFGYSPVAAGSMLALAQLGGVAGRVVWGVLADRLGNGRAVLIGLALALAALAVALPFAGPYSAVAILIGLGATAIGWNGIFLAEVVRLAPDRRVGDATAVVLAGTYLGVCFGPALFAAATPLFPSYASAFSLLALSGLAAAALLLRGGRARR